MNKIFKIGLLVLGFGYLAYLYGVEPSIGTADAQVTTTNVPITNPVGRYSFHKLGSTVAVFDNTKAKLYYLLTGEADVHSVVRKNDLKWREIGPRTER